MIEVNANRTRMPLSAYGEGHSALSCSKCKTHFTAEQETIAMLTYKATCLKCANNEYVDEMRLTILPGYWDLLRAENIKNRVWYHASDKPDWLTGMRKIYGNHDSLLVHVGSLESALDRANVRQYSHLYEVEIKPTARISPTVVDDSNMWPIKRSHMHTYGAGHEYTDVTRYVNRYEIPGSISLLADCHMIEVKNVTQI